MYLTSHSVRAPNGAEAVHAFKHVHGEIDWPPDVTDWPEANPGKLVAQRAVLPVGGNEVHAYLDVLAPDGSPASALEQALELLASDLAERRNPTVLKAASVTLRFGVSPQLEPMRGELFAQLVQPVIELARGSS